MTAAGDAGQVTRAFIVHSAFNGARSARHFTVFVKNKAVFAYTNRTVSSDLAPFALIASNVLKLARVLTSTEQCVACVISRALVVSRAGGHHRDWSGSRSARDPRWSCHCDGSRSRDSAASRIRRAFHSRTADVALRARAAGLVQDHRAEGVLAASVAQRARVLTASVHAGLVRRAVVVVGARAV